MIPTVKVELDKDEFSAETSNLLKGAKSEKLIDIAAYQVRTTINFASVTATDSAKNAAVAEAQTAANQFTKERFAEIDKLVAELKELLAKDKNGDSKAGGKAKDRVKKVSDDMEETLTDFGPRIRKAVEKKTGKLPGAARSVSSGGFRGIRLLAKFEHADASGLDVKINPETLEWLKGHNEESFFRTTKAEIEKEGDEADNLEKVINKIYQIKCPKNVHHFIICQINGNILTMTAIYDGEGKKKKFVAGTPVKDVDGGNN